MEGHMNVNNDMNYMLENHQFHMNYINVKRNQIPNIMRKVNNEDKVRLGV